MKLDSLLYPTPQNPLPLREGNVLIAHPSMTQGFFKGSVIYIIRHDPNGSMGYILNRDSGDNMEKILWNFPLPDLPFSIGGPVGLDRLNFLHNIPALEKDAEALHIGEGIFWSGSMDVLQEKIICHDVDESSYRFFLGYCGWSGGQLESEMETGSWAVGHLNPEQILMPQEDLWRTAVEQLGPEYKFWLQVPYNPHWN